MLFNVLRVRPLVSSLGFAILAFSFLPSLSLRAEEPVVKVGPGTAKMAALLEKIHNLPAAQQNPFASDLRAARQRAALSGITNKADEVSARAELARELLNAGESEEALAEFKRADELAKSFGTVPSRFRRSMDLYMALCELRKGEQENCLAFHGPDSCLMPIMPTAVYKKQAGPRAAIASLTDMLSRSSGNFQAVWLLNIAYMTVGEWPDKVPKQWLIPPKAFASEYELPRFHNVSAKVGLDQEGLAGGVVADDFDNDGDFDLMVSEWGMRDQLRYHRNNGDGTFTERTVEAGLTGLVGGLNMVQADFNNDGFVDVLLLRGAWLGAAGHYPDSLIRNNGDGTFEDVTEKAGMLSFHPSQNATWFDFNGDGWIDVFIGNESSGAEVHPCELYRNNGNGTFTECAAAAGIAVVNFVKGSTSGDYDNDGRPDLYLSIRGDTNILFRNEGPSVTNDARSPWLFRNTTRQAGVGEPISSFPTWFFDYDNDGWQDLFVSGYLIRDVGDIAQDYLGLPNSAERPRLYHNNGNGTFSDVTKQAGVYRVLHTMGCNFGDLDNDGYLDFYLATGDPDLSTIIPNRMFRNNAGKQFQDVTTAGGFGHLQKGHAVTFADLDNDGDQDIYASIGGAYTGDVYRKVLFENPGTSNRWIGLKLEGVKSNRSAIGARIKVTTKADRGARQIFKIVNSGGSFGANSLAQQIGVADATQVDVEIFWPTTGKTDSLKNLATGQWYRMREGDPNAVLTKVKPAKLGGVASTAVTH